MRFARVAIALPLVGVLALSSCGSDSDSGQSSGAELVEISMVDNDFKPDTVEVSKGETVTFRFQNNGAAVHEAVIGDDAVQERHAEEMSASTTTDSGSMPGSSKGSTSDMGMDHDSDGESDDAVTVEPGETAELTVTFDKAEKLVIGCHQPDHWEAGMKATVNVT